MLTDGQNSLSSAGKEVTHSLESYGMTDFPRAFAKYSTPPIIHYSAVGLEINNL